MSLDGIGVDDTSSVSLQESTETIVGGDAARIEDVVGNSFALEPEPLHEVNKSTETVSDCHDDDDAPFIFHSIDSETNSDAFLFRVILLPSRQSAIGRVEHTMRVAMCTALALVLVSLHPLNSVLAIPCLVPAFAIAALQTSFGATVAVALSLLNASVIACIGTCLLQVTTAYESLYSVGAGIFIYAFVVGYFVRDLVTMRIALAIGAIWFLHVIGEQTPDYAFAGNLIISFLCAVTFAVAAAVFPYPRFATLEHSDRFLFGCARIAHLFTLYTRAFVTTDRVAADVTTQRAAAIESSLIANIAAMRVRLNESDYEPRYLLELMLPGCRTHNATPTYLIDHLHDMAWCVITMGANLQAVSFNDYHQWHVKLLRQPMMQVADAVTALLETVSRNHIDGSSALAQQMHLQQKWNKFHSAFLRARHRHYVDTGSRAESSSPKSTAKVTPPKLSPTAAAAALPIAFVPRDAMAMNSFHFAAGSLVQHLLKMDLKHCRDQRSLPLIERVSETMSRFDFNHIFIRWREYGAATFAVNDWPNSYLYNAAVACEALKIAIAMLLASLIELIPATAERFDQGFWCALTVGLLYSPNVGALTERAGARLVGTLLGVSAAYLINKAVDENLYGVIPLTTFLAFISRYFVTGKTNIYAGNSATFTAIILLYGFPLNTVSSISEYAFIRVEETILGVIIVLCVCSLLRPVKPKHLIKAEIANVLLFSKETVRTSITTYQAAAMANASADDTTTTTIVAASTGNQSRSVSIAQSITKQRALHGEAQYALSLWKREYEAAQFEAIIKTEVTLWRLLDSLNAALHGMLDDRVRIRRSGDESSYHGFLQDLTSFQEKVCTFIDGLLERIQRDRQETRVEMSISNRQMIDFHAAALAIDAELMQWTQLNMQTARKTQLSSIPTSTLIFSLHSFLFSAKAIVHSLIDLAQTIQTISRNERSLAYK